MERQRTDRNARKAELDKCFEAVRRREIEALLRTSCLREMVAKAVEEAMSEKEARNGK